MFASFFSFRPLDRFACGGLPRLNNHSGKFPIKIFAFLWCGSRSCRRTGEGRPASRWREFQILGLRSFGTRIIWFRWKFNEASRQTTSPLPDTLAAAICGTSPPSMRPTPRSITLFRRPCLSTGRLSTSFRRLSPKLNSSSPNLAPPLCFTLRRRAP